jgi:hypothetical protein
MSSIDLNVVKSIAILSVRRTTRISIIKHLLVLGQCRSRGVPAENHVAAVRCGCSYNIRPFCRICARETELQGRFAVSLEPSLSVHVCCKLAGSRD